MKISILTLFPDMFVGPFDSSIIKRARDKNLVSIEYVNLRNFATDSYKTVDDHPYGGGVGMILKVDVVDRAITHIKTQDPSDNTRVILLDPQGKRFEQVNARRLTAYEHLVLVCGHYEGIDERIRELVDEELSVGDYILTGGELPAMIITDATARLLSGVLTKKEATEHESFEQGLLEYPQYTRPETYLGKSAPDVLLSGNHALIRAWRQQEAVRRTIKRRPDLMEKKGPLSPSR